MTNELHKLSKKELIKVIGYRNRTIKNQMNTTINKQSQIRHFRRRLKKIKDSIDYLLIHPFSNDTGYKALRHTRDTHNKKSKIQA